MRIKAPRHHIYWLRLLLTFVKDNLGIFFILYQTPKLIIEQIKLNRGKNLKKKIVKVQDPCLDKDKKTEYKVFKIKKNKNKNNETHKL